MSTVPVSVVRNSVPVSVVGDGDLTTSLVDGMHITIQAMPEADLNSSASGEPPVKRLRQNEDDFSPDQSQSVKQILFNINKAICLRLDAIENKLETVNVRSKYLEEKVEQLVSHARLQASAATNQSNSANNSPNDSFNPFKMYKPTILKRNKGGAVVVGLPQEREPGDSQDGFENSLGQTSGLGDPVQNLGPNVTLITLNSEEDFPTGTWMGDESNPEMRVRVPITPSDLLHIHSNCRTPEKMALTMLDYLFDRDTQANSNLSGMGKHGKKQLDPLMIYGIRCHLIHRFAISEQDWHRIKQNIDSKCRTAFRRKNRGLPLTVKAFRGKAPPMYVHVTEGGMELCSGSDESMQQDDSELHIQEEVDLSHGGVLSAASITDSSHVSQLLAGAGGQIQVLHATPEQVAQLQQTHQIQILQGDQIMQLQQADSDEGIQVSVSMPGIISHQEAMRVVSASNGELQIAQGIVTEEDDDDVPVTVMQLKQEVGDAEVSIGTDPKCEP